MEHKLSQELFEGQAICNKISDNLFKCEKDLDLFNMSDSEKNTLHSNSTLLSQLNCLKLDGGKLGVNTDFVDDAESYPQELLSITDKM